MSLSTLAISLSKLLHLPDFDYLVAKNLTYYVTSVWQESYWGE